MMKILYLKEVPFFLTILLGLLVYQLNFIFESQSNSPLLAFKHVVKKKSTENGNIKKTVECKVTNLSKRLALSDIELMLSFKTQNPNPKIIFNSELIPVAPSEILPDSNVVNIYDLMSSFKINKIQPGASYVLKYQTLQNPKCSKFPSLYLKSSDNIKLLEPSLLTFLIKNQISISIVLLIICLCLIILYMLKLNKNEKDSNN